MGLFCCCFRPKDFQNERKCILEDRIGANIEVTTGLPSEIGPNINSPFYRKPDIGLSQQNLFDITAQQMEAKMINIPALKNDQLFKEDSQKSYHKRVYSIRKALPLLSDTEKRRSKFTPYERCSNLKTISKEDLKLINDLSEKSSKAVKKGFNFWTDQPFVVEFNLNKN